MMAHTHKSEHELTAIRERYLRRESLPRDWYDPISPANLFLAHERERLFIEMLRKHNLQDRIRQAEILEVGCGSGENLARLRLFGVQASRLHGVELLEARVDAALRMWPELDIRQGDAARLPYRDQTLDFVLQSTVFTSILLPELQDAIAQEMVRVLKPDGAILWYDFRVNNPRNPDVRGVSRRRVEELFQGMRSDFFPVTLAPPIARLLVPRLTWLARSLNCFPFLRTHYWAILWRPGGETT